MVQFINTAQCADSEFNLVGVAEILMTRVFVTNRCLQPRSRKDEVGYFLYVSWHISIATFFQSRDLITYRDGDTCKRPIARVFPRRACAARFTVVGCEGTHSAAA